jgi:serine/threonine-protein kinase
MDTARWDLAGNIFERLLGAAQGERPALLETLCGEDAELKKLVVSMLESENSALRFEQQLERGSLTLETTTAVPVEQQQEVQVGPWHLVSKLGSGGMGVVWLAERADGQFEQRAALKLIKRGMDSEEVLKRFLRERQILARLDHPHIAHLLDGGIAADGRPYFAMEYVEGLPLLRYCHERGAKLEERLKLFLDVCAAVQFAHEHHVVHRDLKPSNVLVTATTGVKLLDFGIAKLLQMDDSSPDAITHLQRERPMTPAYAAPEQIRGDKITEATDIYALGCVLYELLTGKRSYDFSGAHEPKDVLRIIEAAHPTAPSRLKLTAPPLPQRSLRGDLDTIVLTALRREPERRYASVAAMSADLQNFLDGKPISARRDSLFYRGWKFVRRHRTGLAASVMVAAIAAATLTFELRDRTTLPPASQGTSMAIVDFNNLSQNAESAWLSPALAEMLATQLATGGKVHVLPDELVRSARIGLAAPMAGGYAMKSLATLRKRIGADYVLSGSYFVSGAGGDAKVRLDLALQDARGGTAKAVLQNGALGDLPTLVDKAGAALRESLGYVPVSTDDARRIDKALPPSTEVARRMGNALDAMRRHDPARAKEELLQAIALSPGYAPAYSRLSEAWALLGYDGKALATAEQAAAHSENLPKPEQLRIERTVALRKAEWARVLELDRLLVVIDSTDPNERLKLIVTLTHAGDFAGAEETLADLRKLPGAADDPRIELMTAVLAGKQSNIDAQVQHATRALDMARLRDAPALAADAKQELAWAYSTQGRRVDAQALIREAIADYVGVDNPKGEADARQSLAIFLVELGSLPEAREEYQKALTIYQRIGDRSGLASSYANQSRMLWDAGDHDGALTAARNCLALQRERENVPGIAWALMALAILQADDATSDAVLENMREAISLDERADERVNLVFALHTYALHLSSRGKLSEAKKACDQAVAKAAQLQDPSTQASTELDCGKVALDRGEVATAVTAFDQVRKLAEQIGDAGAWSDAAITLARIEIARESWGKAAALLVDAIERLRTREDVAGEGTAQAFAALVYSAQDKSAERDQAAGKARALRARITTRQNAFPIDIALAQLPNSDTHGQVSELLALAADAEGRQWLAQSLEAKFAAWQILERNHDASAPHLREQILAVADEHGFGWLQARLRPAPKP